MEQEKTRDERTELRRRQIIEAALKCFTELGYTETTMADIRKRSGASTGSIYHHFKGKDQLAAATYLEGIRSYQQGLVEAVKKHKGAKAGIYGIICYHLRWVEINMDWARYLQHMRHARFMAETDKEFMELNKQFIEAFTPWVKGHMEAKKLRRMKRDVFTSLLLGPCQEYVRQWISGVTVTDVNKAIKELSAAAWAALKDES